MFSFLIEMARFVKTRNSLSHIATTKAGQNGNMKHYVPTSSGKYLYFKNKYTYRPHGLKAMESF